MSDQTSLSKLVELARTIQVTAEAKEEQRRSFVFGNVAIEDETRTLTKAMVDERAKQLAAQ